ncbi:MAG: hypothetical protein U5K76_08500 [Woeseiaceae bacterium]|nr:hypothetical protein [Woeseiaceae bacterium]
MHSQKPRQLAFATELDGWAAVGISTTVTAEAQFWMNWWVALGAAAATFFAVLVALFGQYLRAGLFPPKLTLSILDPRLGSSARVKLSYAEGNVVEGRPEEARSCRLVLENSRRWSPAHEVQVYLLHLEKPGPERCVEHGVDW